MRRIVHLQERRSLSADLVLLTSVHLKCATEGVTVTTTVMMSGSVEDITTTTGTRAVTQAKQFLLFVSVITIQTVPMVMMRVTVRI